MVTQPQVQKPKGAVERRKLTVISIGRVDYWGDHNLPVLKFRAGEGDSEYTYEVFNRPALIAAVRNGVGQVLECDVETVETENGYTDRKIRQVYIDGEPVEKQEREGWGGYRGKSPEDRLSIERQTCLRCACDMFPAGTTTTEDILLSAEKMFRWVHSSLTETASLEADREFGKAGRVETANTEKHQPARRQFANAGILLTAATKELHLTVKEVLVKLKITDIGQITDYAEAWEELKGRR